MFFGEISYSTFLLHTTVIHLFVRYALADFRPWLKGLDGTAATTHSLALQPLESIFPVFLSGALEHPAYTLNDYPKFLVANAIGTIMSPA